MGVFLDTEREAKFRQIRNPPTPVTSADMLADVGIWPLRSPQPLQVALSHWVGEDKGRLRRKQAGKAGGGGVGGEAGREASRIPWLGPGAEGALCSSPGSIPVRVLCFLGPPGCVLAARHPRACPGSPWAGGFSSLPDSGSGGPACPVSSRGCGVHFLHPRSLVLSGPPGLRGRVQKRGPGPHRAGGTKTTACGPSGQRLASRPCKVSRWPPRLAPHTPCLVALSLGSLLASQPPGNPGVAGPQSPSREQSCRGSQRGAASRGLGSSVLLGSSPLAWREVRQPPRQARVESTLPRPW